MGHRRNAGYESVRNKADNLYPHKKTVYALLIFHLNTEMYQQSANVYDSYGECLLILGKKIEALAAYKKSLELNPENSNAKAMTKKLSE